MTAPYSSNTVSTGKPPVEQTLILIGLVYNSNGMATWCIEAARALQQLGYRNVYVATQKSVRNLLPGDIQAIEVDTNIGTSFSILDKIKWRIRRIGFFVWKPDADPHLGTIVLKQFEEKLGQPGIIFWNQSNLLCSKVPIAQWVVGWAFPFTLGGYLRKALLPGHSNMLNRVINIMYWYRTDKWAYSKAFGVLSVTRALESQLLARANRIIHAPPSVSLENISIKDHVDGPVRLLLMALDLEDKRKNYAWVINALATIQTSMPWQLELVGEASETFRTWAQNKIPTAVFHGRLTREKAKAFIQQMDVMIFNSNLDDWGFVQVEAMAAGLAVLAPGQIPSLEIIPESQLFFTSDNQSEFLAKLEQLLNNRDTLKAMKQACQHQVMSQFSSHKFGSLLHEACLMSFSRNLVSEQKT